jgi:hypothetical protein
MSKLIGINSDISRTQWLTAREIIWSHLSLHSFLRSKYSEIMSLTVWRLLLNALSDSCVLSASLSNSLLSAQEFTLPQSSFLMGSWYLFTLELACFQGRYLSLFVAVFIFLTLFTRTIQLTTLLSSSGRYSECDCSWFLLLEVMILVRCWGRDLAGKVWWVNCVRYACCSLVKLERFVFGRHYALYERLSFPI